METNRSLPRLALLFSLFWLLRHVVVPASRYALMLLCGLALVVVSMPLLARRCWDWYRPQPDCPATKALRSAVAAVLAGAPFFILLAVAGLTK